MSSTDPVAVIGAVTYTPTTGDLALYFRFQQQHFTGDSIFAFLRDIAEFLPRDVMFFLDNLPSHFPAVAQLEEEFAETATGRCRVVSYVRSRTQSQRIRLEKPEIRRIGELRTERAEYAPTARGTATDCQTKSSVVLTLLFQVGRS